MSGEERYHNKRRLGISPTRRDGSAYSADTDRQAQEAEEFVLVKYDGLHDDVIYTSGDPGYDLVVLWNGSILRVNVEHAGCWSDGTPRLDRCHLIVNPGDKKLSASDVLVLIGGPPWREIGAMPTAVFREQQVLREFGYGPKQSMPSAVLWDVARAFDEAALRVK